MKEVNLLKRIVYAVLAVILVLGTTTSALAAENGMIRPNYVGVSSIKPVITLASNGTVGLQLKLVIQRKLRGAVNIRTISLGYQ